MASKLFKDLRDTELNHEGKAVYQGDPIFIVDFKTLTIKTCIAKTATVYDYSKFMAIQCCEKGKYSNWSPFKEKTPSDWINLFVNKNSSTSSYASTTLKGAMKILDLYNSKGSFASLEVGDKVYYVNTIKNELRELNIESLEGSKYRPYYTQNKSEIYRLRFGGKNYLQLGAAYYEGKASINSDNYFVFYLDDCCGNVYFFVKKEEAEAFLNKRIKQQEKANELPPIGTDTNLNDAKGNRLHIGDSVAYVNGVGTHISLSTAKIIKATKVYITVLDEGKREENIRYAKEALDNWVKEGHKPYELDFTYYGVYTVTTNKVLLLKKYNKK
jgi:hypothetical protein